MIVISLPIIFIETYIKNVMKYQAMRHLNFANTFTLYSNRKKEDEYVVNFDDYMLPYDI